jgi:hypothetical protein
MQCFYTDGFVQSVQSMKNTGMAFIAFVVTLLALAGSMKARSSRFQAEVLKIADHTRYREITDIEELKVGGHLVRKAVLAKKQLVGLPHGMDLEYSDPEPTVPPQWKWLMPRSDDCITIWAAPGEAGASLQAKIRLPEKTSRWYRKLFYLGRYGGSAWYGYMSIYDFANIEKDLPMSGEDVIAAEIHGCGVADFDMATSRSCEFLLGEEGSKALPAIDTAIALRLPQRRMLVSSMHGCKDPVVIKWLISRSFSQDSEVVVEARDALLRNPVPEASELYLKWLAAEAGSKDVSLILHACLEVKATEAVPYADRILASPPSFDNYREALGLCRLAAGRPAIPPAMLEQQKQVTHFGYRCSSNSPGRDFEPGKVKEAQTEILKSNDAEAAAVVGLTLALHRTKGDAQIINEAGIDILKQLPGGQAKKLVSLLVKHSSASWEAENIAAIGRRLN